MIFCALFLPLSGFADPINTPNTLTNNTVADAQQVQENFDAVVSESNQNDGRITDIEALIKLDNSTFAEGALDPGVASGVWEGDEKQGNFFLGSGTTEAVLQGTENAFNTSLGVDTLSNLGQGFSNVAIGYRAMRDAAGTSVEAPGAISSNVAVGAFALEDLRDYPGIGNTAIGTRAMWRATSAVGNTGVGAEVLQQLTTGANNIGVGGVALRGTTTGNRNVALGYRALGDNVTGGNNIAIGYRADVTLPDLFNATVIGFRAKISESNSVQLGNQFISNVYLGRRVDQAVSEEETPVDANLHLLGKMYLGALVYPNYDGTAGQVLATDGSGTLDWVDNSDNDTLGSLTGCAEGNVPRWNGSAWECSVDTYAVHTKDLETQIATLQSQLAASQEQVDRLRVELATVVESQQQQIARLLLLVDDRFAAR